MSGKEIGTKECEKKKENNIKAMVMLLREELLITNELLNLGITAELVDDDPLREEFEELKVELEDLEELELLNENLAS